MLLTLVVTLVHFSVVPAGVPSIGDRINRLNRIFSAALSEGSGWTRRMEDCDAFLVLEGPSNPLPRTSCGVLYSNASGGRVEGDYDIILTSNRSIVPFMERKGNVYYFDPTHYEEKNIQLLLEKDHLLSVVLPRDFMAQQHLQNLVVNATEIMPDHVYVEGSSSYSRMFKRYRFTLLYGGLDDGEFPPRVLVEAMAHHTIPLVPVGEMKKVIPFHFHMGEAVWGIYSLELPAAIVMLEDLMTNEKKEENVFYRLETQRMTQDVFQYRYHLPIETRLHAHVCTLCQIHKGRQGLAERSVVFVGIFSARRNFLLRQTLRQTWVSLLRRMTFDSGRVDYRFFVGKGPEEVSREQAAYGDLAELDVWDTYRNVTLKSLRMFQYVTERWSDAVYFLRVDDDVYLRPIPLLDQIVEHRVPVRYLWGFYDYASVVVRDPDNKKDYNDPRVDYSLAERFPLYVRGNLYVASMDLVRMVVQRETEGGLHSAHPDDPAFGTYLFQLVAERRTFVQIDDRDENRIALNPYCEHQFSRLHNRTWAVHHLNISQLRCMWRADVRAGYYKPRYRHDDEDHDQLEGLYLPRGGMATSDAEISAFQDTLLSASNPREYEPLDVVSDSRRNGFADICPCAVAQRGPHDGHTYHYPYERFMP